jgi:hypothetical protein
MSKKTAEQPDFLAEILDLQEQIDSLKKRLELVEENREKVRQKIYEKVKFDYEAKLDELYEKLQPYREKMETEISVLEDEISKRQDDIDRKQEELEEFQLRFFAGEFSEDDFQPRQSELLSSIDNTRTEITDCEKTIANFRDHLAFITGEPVEEQKEPDKPAENDESIYETPEPHPEVDEIVEDAGELEEEPEFGEAPVLGGETDDTFLKDTAGGLSFSDNDLSPEKPSEEDEEDYIWRSTPVLDVVDGDFSGESYTIDKERMTMGRGPNNDIQFATDTSVSRHHAQIVFENNKYYLLDLESSNGSSVNGIRVSRAALRPNDEITIGVSKLIIRAQD